MLQVTKTDNSKGKDSMDILKGINLRDKGRWIGQYKLTKYDFTRADGSIDTKTQEAFELDSKKGLSAGALKDKYGVFLKSDEVIGENLLLNAGINTMLSLLAGGAGTAYNNANARIGVGDSATAAAASQTALQAATNKLLVAMDASYPTYGSSQQIVFRSTFTGAQANYAWAEFVVDNGGTALVALNRLVSAQGTKTSGQTWQVTLTITIS